MNIPSFLHTKISSAVEDLYHIQAPNFVVEHPDNESFGDYSTNIAMVLSKLLKQNPLEIAKNISYRIKEIGLDNVDIITSESFISSVECLAPGFINFRISTEWLQKLPMLFLDPSFNYGVAKIDSKKRVALEHSNVNPNKAAHIGHLRNACIGQFIERAYEKLGYQVDVQYYANNVGVQVATSAMGVRRLTQFDPNAYQKFDHYAWDVYSAMETLISESESLQKERLALLLKLEDPQSPEAQDQKLLAEKILLSQLTTFSNLGIDYDVIIYESDILALKLWEAAFRKLKINPNVYYSEDGKSKGCWLVRLDTSESTSDISTVASQDEIEKDKIIVRSNGAVTYTGKDIAYHMWKFGLLEKDFGYSMWDTKTQSKPLWKTESIATPDLHTTFSHADYVYDVIGVEQTYAIDVVRQSLGFLGYPEHASRMKHVNYGFVYLSRNTASKLGIDVSDGKKFYGMSGRKGWGVKIDDLIKMTDDRLLKEHGNFDNVAAVRNAAIKFQMLKGNTFQDLIFDLDEALDIKGFSGPYIQYAYVRALSIIRKSKELGVTVFPENTSPLVLGASEESLLRMLYRYSEILEKSAHEFTPNVLCEFLFELSKRFNTLYNGLPILTDPDENSRNFRLSLCSCVEHVLRDGLYTLGIESPDKM